MSYTYLEELLVARATVEDLLDEDLLVGVSQLQQQKSELAIGLGRLTVAMNSSAYESIVLMTGLNPLMHVMQ